MANKIVSKSGIKKVVARINTMRFEPSKMQAAFKIKYYNKAKLHNIISPELANIDEIQALAGMDSDTLATWWQPEFEAWFRDKTHVIDKVDAMFENSIDEIGDIIQNSPQDQNKLAAIRLLADIRKGMQEKKEEGGSAVNIEQLLPLLKELGFVKIEDSKG